MTDLSHTNPNPPRPGLVIRRAGKKSLFILISLAAVSLVASIVLPQPASPRDQPIQFPPPPANNDFELVSVLAPDAIPAIVDPVLVSAEMAAPELNPDERVIGLVINGDARAYPISVLSAHEIVNDVVGGELVAITWCPLCYTAVVFSRWLEGHELPLVFGVSGKLLHNTLIMYDHQSETLWSQLYGAGVEGPLAGLTLGYFPSVHTEWEVWRNQFPDTMVLSKQDTCIQFDCSGYEVDRYTSYYQSSAEGVIDRQIPRESELRRSKERVLGVVADTNARAYPFKLLAEKMLINDQVGDVPILIWFDPSSETGTAFDRRLDARVLFFDNDPTEAGILIDKETGSRWRAFTGESFAGPLAGRGLDPLFTTAAFEFAWSAYYPHSDTYPH